MRALLLLISITLLATGPAAAQRFAGGAPVCLQVWEWGGSSSISCEFRSLDACRAAAAGLPAMCLPNPYGESPLERVERHRRLPPR
ncbi:Conserved hypothetical protein; putative signal peptide [Bradyrhizobium sp. ORS 278]|nr:DUF3551 domain-containing protein [Bradyrhizobium sp. ORS 278]CAL78793.1 Conserved hypothetical protein; putative signal peptide [Bradyrhizobium sp. ORS 278]